MEGFKINLEPAPLQPGNAGIPDTIMTSEKIAAMRAIRGLAIGEIAGRDSIAAIIKACESHAMKAIVPTVVYTGTEYGNWSTVESNVEFLKARIGNEHEVLDTVFIGSPQLWAALNGRYISVIYKEYGMYSPCLACHLYMHLCRVPLSLALGTVPIISGERNTHQGSIKLSQTSSTIDACIKVIAHAGVELLLPIRDIEDNGEIGKIIGDNWEQGKRQFKCVLSENYAGLNGEVSYDKAAHERYLNEFLVPCGKAIADAWHDMGPDLGTNPPSIDYDSIVASILKSITGMTT